MSIEELAFKDRKILANLNAIDLLDIIEFLQEDRNQWINQFTKTHNEGVEIQKENQQLKDNWNKLKEIAKSQSGFKKRADLKGGLWFEIDELLDKMQELEQGSDSNEKPVGILYIDDRGYRYDSLDNLKKFIGDSNVKD